MPRRSRRTRLRGVWVLGGFNAFRNNPNRASSLAPEHHHDQPIIVAHHSGESMKRGGFWRVGFASGWSKAGRWPALEGGSPPSKPSPRLFTCWGLRPQTPKKRLFKDNQSSSLSTLLQNTVPRSIPRHGDSRKRSETQLSVWRTIARASSRSGRWHRGGTGRRRRGYRQRG